MELAAFIQYRAQYWFFTEVGFEPTHLKITELMTVTTIHWAKEAHISVYYQNGPIVYSLIWYTRSLYYNASLSVLLSKSVRWMSLYNQCFGIGIIFESAERGSNPRLRVPARCEQKTQPAEPQWHTQLYISIIDWWTQSFNLSASAECTLIL